MRFALTVQQKSRLSLVQSDSTPIECDPVDISADITGAATSFVLRPGGVASDGVYVDWPTLSAAAAAVDPAAFKIVSIDDSLAAAHIVSTGMPAGGWPGFENTFFTSGGADGSGGAIANLICDQGAQLAGISHLNADTLGFTFNSTLPLIPTTTKNLSVQWRGVTSSNGAGAVGLADIGAGHALSFRAYSSAVTGQLFTGSATSTYALLFFSGSSFPTNGVNGTAGGTVILVVDGASQVGVSATQTPAAGLEVLDPIAAFVFRPGATGLQNANVFTTWAALMAVTGLTPGTKFIYVDDSLATANTSAGSWTIEGCIFTSFRDAAGPVLHVVEGTVFVSTTRFIVLDSLTVSCDATATVPFVSSATVNPVVRAQILGAAVLKSTGAIPFFQSSAGGNINNIIDNGATLGDGTHNVHTIDAGQSGRWQAYSSSSLLAHAVGGAGTLNVVCDPSGQAITQDATTVSVAVVNQNVIGQTTNLGAAVASPATFTPSSTNITRKRDGKVNAKAGFSGTASAAGLVTLALLRDAVTVAQGQFQVKTGGDAFAINLDVIDTLPDGAAHGYTYTLTNGAGGTFTGVASGTYLWVNESV